MALSISGSDPTGGAGLQLDVQVFRTLGVHGAAIPTALTVQDTAKVHKVLPVFGSAILDMIRVLLRDCTPDAVKIGMLGTDDVARAVAHALYELPESVPIVIDPVIAASDGSALLERRAYPTLIELIGRSRLALPNLSEASTLSGQAIDSPEDAQRAAGIWLEEFGAQAVLLTGGHWPGAPRDLLAEKSGGGVSLRWLEGERIEGDPVHGTGCALASAVTALLAQGECLDTSIERARQFVRDGIERAGTIGKGARVLGF